MKYIRMPVAMAFRLDMEQTLMNDTDKIGILAGEYDQARLDRSAGGRNSSRRKLYFRELPK
ncbi:hypothetical protein AA13594_0504 [Gluconacetobacter azotocaptans DSM 13594]|nr:hypothetical protein AA13594_0504 [Gluconacetobacter azotocaptans DSM 13594]